jgi:hypothetical protein
MTEIKYIIVRDKTSGHLRHFKSDWLYHYTLARDKGFDSSDIIEAGILLDKKLFILECIIASHFKKASYKFIINTNYQDLRLEAYNKGRESESLYSYGYIKEGD